MPEWNEICCAIDFSEPARLAMEQAADLARRFGAALTLVHVHEPPRTVPTDLLAAGHDVAAMVAAEEERSIAGWRSDAQRLSGGRVESCVLVGAPAAEIARFAGDRGCDLVVLGTHGRTGFRRFVLGSVAEQVVRQAPCPVLVVRGREAPEPAADPVQRTR